MLNKFLADERGFSLTELLVVIAAIALLASLLMPVLAGAKNAGNRTACMANLRQLDAGMRMYVDDSGDLAPNTPGTHTNWSLSFNGYKNFMKSYVGVNDTVSPLDKLFACPSDTFYFAISNGFTVLVPLSAHENPYTEYSSYAFNGGNANTNLAQYGLDCSTLGIAGLSISAIKNPARTALIFEAPAANPYSWHEPKLPLDPSNSQFSDARDVLGFVDGHVSYIKMHWSGSRTNGLVLTAADENPPDEYDYQWSGK